MLPSFLCREWTLLIIVLPLILLLWFRVCGMTRHCNLLLLQKSCCFKPESGRVKFHFLLQLYSSGSLAPPTPNIPQLIPFFVPLNKPSHWPCSPFPDWLKENHGLWTLEGTHLIQLPQNKGRNWSPEKTSYLPKVTQHIFGGTARLKSSPNFLFINRWNMRISVLLNLLPHIKYFKLKNHWLTRKIMWMSAFF